LRLARATGFNSRRSFYEGQNLPLTATELAEWEVDYGIEPWGERRGDLQAGIVAAALLPGSTPEDHVLRFVPAEQHKNERLERAQEALKLAGSRWGRQKRKG
jgi:hypothetical protein